MKYYTDECLSPRAQIVLGEEELKITLAHVVKGGGKESTPQQKVPGVIIRFP